MGETEAQRDQEPCPKSHTQLGRSREPRLYSATPDEALGWDLIFEETVKP